MDLTLWFLRSIIYLSQKEGPKVQIYYFSYLSIFPFLDMCLYIYVT